MAGTQIKTRVLIVSDTHGMDLDIPELDRSADVVVHCGDLTDSSILDEYRKTIETLKRIDAPLKLAIAGNHDFTLDIPAFEKKVSEACPTVEPDLVTKFYGAHGDARRLFAQAGDSDIVFLDEGSDSFTLQNGALLTLYASPYTPSLGAWGFQYRPEQGHDFNIQKGIDLVITHGPPKGIMDFTHGRERAGCPRLFAAVARARPRIHCFGHIHEGWGAKLVSWKDEHEDQPEEEQEDCYLSRAATHFSAIDDTKSMLIEKLATLKSRESQSERQLEKRNQQQKYHATSHCDGDERPLDFGSETLFINAAITGDGGRLTQRPWLVDIELPRAGSAATEPITTSALASTPKKPNVSDTTQRVKRKRDVDLGPSTKKKVCRRESAHADPDGQIV